VTPLGCVTGRFQPVHRQHLELFEIALDAHEHLAVGVTNPDTEGRRRVATSAHRHTSAANPFTYFERSRLLAAAVAERGLASRVTIVPFDLNRSATWDQYVPLDARQYVRAYSDWERQKADWLREAGYEVTVLVGVPDTRLSASDIRRLLRAGGDWPSEMPPATVPVLRDLLARRPMDRR
jgi:nicotinamide mononucleotide adenylyltransferase